MNNRINKNLHAQQCNQLLLVVLDMVDLAMH
jgi:hypothetical protein